jgi:hypothetical protein
VPDRASAFTGESLVINPVTKALTPAAEKIFKGGKSIGELVVNAGKSGGVAGESRAVGVLEEGGTIPQIGLGALSFGVGTKIGSDICHSILGLEGCWYYESEGADPVETREGKWEWMWTPPHPEWGEWPMQYYFKISTGYNFLYLGKGGVPKEKCGIAPPTQAALFWAAPEATNCGEGPTAHFTDAMRYSMANRTFGWSATDSPGRANSSYEAGSNWAKEQGKAFTETEEGGEVGQAVAHAIAPTEIPNPYATYVKVPDACATGTKAAKCLKEAKELDLVPEVTELPWEDAVIEELKELDPEKTREEESEKIIEISPPPKTTVETGSELVITTNPDTEDMPEWLPAPDKGGGEDGEGEDPDEYKKRLIPIFIPNVETLGDATLDPEVGPGRVSHTVPGSHHRFNPHVEHEVEIDVNPKDAPQPGAGGGGHGGSCGGSVGAVDWSPLNHSLGSKFPFGVFGFFVTWIGEWEAGEGVAPSWSVTLLPSGVFGSKGLSVPVDLAFMSPVVGFVRVALLFASFVGLLWFLGTAAAKIQGDGS